LSFVGGLVVFAIGAVVLIGWHLDIGALKSILPSIVSMKANTAVAFVLLGGTIMASSFPEHEFFGFSR
jgi:hypothetical protein